MSEHEYLIQVNIDLFIIRNKNIMNRQQHKYKYLHTLEDVYTAQPIQQYTDKVLNQTSFTLHLQNAFSQAQLIEVESLSEFKCKFCKAYYFPSLHTALKPNILGLNHKHQLSKLSQNIPNKFTCQLCGSMNQTKINVAQIFPSFCLSKKGQDLQDKRNFQSVILSFPSSSSRLKGNFDQSQNKITFIFCIDIDILPKNIQITALTYLKTVIKQSFTRLFQDQQLSNKQKINQNKQQSQDPQIYSLLITLNINEKLFAADLNTISTICIDSLLKDKIFLSISAQNTQQLQQKQAERKQSILELLHSFSLRIDPQESMQRLDQYFDLLIQEKQNSSFNSKYSVQSNSNFNKLIQIIALDKLSNSYVISWISRAPLLNYEPHKVKKCNIYSVVYLFHEDSYGENQKLNPSSFMPELKFQQSNIRNELMLIQDNNEVHFIETQNENNHEFYYNLYELFSVLDSPKFFKPRWSIKTDNKYPPSLTNQLPTFFIKDSSSLHFIVSTLLDKMHKNFQVSVIFENWKKEEQLWMINWTKNSQIEKNKVKNSHKQFQQSLIVYKLPQIYNEFHILSKYVQRICIRGKDDAKSNGLRKQSILSFNSVTSQHICVVFESIINQGMFKANNIEIGIQYVEQIYQYCNAMKNVRYEIMIFLSACQSNIRRAILMIFPMIIYQNTTNDPSWLIYWSSGYALIDKNSQYEPLDAQSWQEQAINQINVNYQKKYFTKRYLRKEVNNNKEVKKRIDNQIQDDYVVNFYIEKVQNKCQQDSQNEITKSSRHKIQFFKQKLIQPNPNRQFIKNLIPILFQSKKKYESSQQL